MSSIAARARAEAEAAEAEERDEQHEGDDEAETEPAHAEHDAEPADEPTPHPADELEEPSDAMIAELQAAVDEHHDHVRAIMGPFVADFVPCETCNGIGIAYPQPAGPKYEHAQGSTTCSVCAGLGEVQTGSKRQGYELIGCTNCNGRGYVGGDNPPPMRAAEAAVAQFPAGNGGEQPPQPSSQPPSTDPRVQQLRDEGFIVLEKPNA